MVRMARVRSCHSNLASPITRHRYSDGVLSSSDFVPLL